MKFLLLILPLVLSSTRGMTNPEADDRQLQATQYPLPSQSFPPLTELEEAWYVTDPVLNYDSATNVFTLNTNLGNDNPFTYYSFEAFDECPNGDPTYNDAELLESTGNFVWKYWRWGWRIFYLQVLSPVTFEQIIAASPGLLESELSFKILPEIVNSDAYNEDPSTDKGTATFCIRVASWDFSLFPAKHPILINFRQLHVTVTYTLDGLFSVESFETQVIEAVEGEFEDTFPTTAVLCEDQENSQPFKQGEEVCIQVCPSVLDSELANVDSIDRLDLKVEIPETSTALTMFVLDDDGPTGNNILAPVCNVDSCCRVTFILSGDFFPVGPSNEIVDPTSNEIRTTALIEGDGECTVTLYDNNGRRLRATRALAETQTSEFETSFEVSRAPQLESNGESFLTKTAMSAAAAGLVGAAFLV